MLKKIGSFPPAIGLAALVAAAAAFLTYQGALGTDESTPSVLSESSSSQEVLGDPIVCLVGENTQFKFETEENEFEVVGLLVSFNGTTAVVLGPSGNVTATLAANFELEGDLSPGTAVKMEGTAEAGGNVARELKSACAGVGVIDCPSGEDPRFKLQVEGATFEVTGTLDSLTSSLVRVAGPGAIVEAAVVAGTEVNIDASSPAGTPVKVEGTVLGPNSFEAREIQSACEEDAAAAEPQEEDEGEDECNHGPGEAGESRVEIEGNEIEIERGTVVSFVDNVLVVDTDGDLGTTADQFTVTIEPGTEVEGDLSTAEEVKVEGTLTNGSTILAEEVKALCPDAAHDADDDDDVDNGDNGDDDAAGDNHNDSNDNDHNDDNNRGDDEDSGGGGSDEGSGGENAGGHG